MPRFFEGQVAQKPAPLFVGIIYNNNTNTAIDISLGMYYNK